MSFVKTDNQLETNQEPSNKLTTPVLATALEELNNKINKEEDKKTYDNTQTGGGSSSKTLKNNIEILKLKLTKKKLQHQLFKNNKNKNKNKTKHKFKKNNVKKNTKHKLK